RLAQGPSQTGKPPRRASPWGSVMNEINRLPDDEPALNELHDPLRGVVEQILSQPTPQESLQRALERARAIQVAPARRWFNLHPEIQVRIAVAAATPVAVAIGWSADLLEDGTAKGRIGSASDRFALIDERPITFPPSQTWTRISSGKEMFGSVQDGTSNGMMISEQFRPF